VFINAVGGSGGYWFAKNDTLTWQKTPIFNRLLGQKAYPIFVRDSVNGCLITTTVFVAGRPPLSIEAGSDYELDLGDSLRRRALANFPIRQILWKAFDGSGDTSIRQPRSVESYFKPFLMTRYQVIASDSIGCEAKDSFRIAIRRIKKVSLPDAFSPNNDGANDWFYPQTSKDVAEIKVFRIFNRWGEMVFERSNFKGNQEDLGWNGMYKGKEQPADVYAWYVEAAFIDGTKSDDPLKGSVHLVR
jgi:large repetitive protein